jgi:uncharacterized membrane protein YeaQ/YmgE (transglycosylase-associated protein family)
MELSTVEGRLRTFLLGMAGCLCVGTSVELLLADHTQTLVQLIPFALCGAGLVVLLLALLRPRRSTLMLLRAVMLFLLAGAVFGVYQHFGSNLAFEQEIRPGAAVGGLWLAALKGAAPLLAPGILGLAALLGLAGTYGQPALQR